MNTALGKYTNYGTIIHKLDCRVKLVSLIIMMVSVFLPYGTEYMNLVFCLGLFVVLIIINIIGKCDFFSIFRSLKAVWFMVLFLFLINVFFSTNTSGDIAFTLWNVDVRWATIINVVYIFARLLLVIMMTNVFASTTKPMDITAALEWLMTPLKFIKVPVHQIAMAISLALRFIPTLQEETEKIMKAQASRGVDFKHGRFAEKMKALVSLIIPLFMSAFMTSGELADALEARGYDPNSRRTRYRTSTFSAKEVIAIILIVLFLAGYILLAIFRPDIFEMLHVELPALK